MAMSSRLNRRVPRAEARWNLILPWSHQRRTVEGWTLKIRATPEVVNGEFRDSPENRGRLEEKLFTRSLR